METSLPPRSEGLRLGFTCTDITVSLLRMPICVPRWFSRSQSRKVSDSDSLSRMKRDISRPQSPREVRGPGRFDPRQLSLAAPAEQLLVPSREIRSSRISMLGRYAGVGEIDSSLRALVERQTLRSNRPSFRLQLPFPQFVSTIGSLALGKDAGGTRKMKQTNRREALPTMIGSPIEQKCYCNANAPPRLPAHRCAHSGPRTGLQSSR
jgi:hypothetical protein